MEQQEPSVLDYIKARLMPWRGEVLQIPPLDEEESSFPKPDTSPHLSPLSEAEEMGQEGVPFFTTQSRYFSRFPWRWLAALGFALFGQLALEPPQPNFIQSSIGYGIATFFLIWALWREERSVREGQPLIIQEENEQQVQVIHYRPSAALAGLILAVLAFAAFGGEMFTPLNLLLWGSSCLLLIYAFWQIEAPVKPLFYRLHELWLSKPSWVFTLSKWGILFISVLLFSAFFRFYRLNEVPLQMISDHAEKLLDVLDIMYGKTSVFFPRNTGREAFQMYLTAAVIELFHTGYTFLSLKIGTTVLGFFTLPFIYLLGKELMNPRVGMWAMAFAGVAYWHNVISRIGLRYTLTPFFTAPALYFLLRGMRRRSVNDFLLSGIFLGLGLHGYSTMRIVPLVFLLALGLYLLHSQSKGWRRNAIIAFVLLSLISFAVFLPLLRYTFEHPEMVAYRTLTRVGDTERALPAPAVEIFFSNLWRAMLMFNVDNGEIWAHSIPHRPALDVVSAALYFIGFLYLCYRYVRERYWQYLFILLSIPFLLLPSILSLAFPTENPCLNRTSAAFIPVMVVVGFGMERVLHAINSSTSNVSAEAPNTEKSSFVLSPYRYSFLIGVFLLLWSSLQNYQLVFNEYQTLYEQSSWNTTEIGSVIRGFTDSIGDKKKVWVVGFPHWVDTRLVAFNAGFPGLDFAIWPDEIASTIDIGGNKLFILKPEDSTGLKTLQDIYPMGVWKKVTSKITSKDFIIYYDIPPIEENLNLNQ